MARRTFLVRMLLVAAMAGAVTGYVQSPSYADNSEYTGGVLTFESEAPLGLEGLDQNPHVNLPSVWIGTESFTCSHVICTRQVTTVIDIDAARTIFNDQANLEDCEGPMFVRAVVWLCNGEVAEGSLQLSTGTTPPVPLLPAPWDDELAYATTEDCFSSGSHGFVLSINGPPGQCIERIDWHVGCCP